MSEKLVDSKLIKKIDTLRLNTNMILHLGSTGERKSHSKGSSVEFSDFREYVPGDDYRKIDWNAYMRFEKLFLKLFVEEREAQVNIVIDNTKSMDFGKKNKLFLAKQIACLLSYIVIGGMDKVKLHYLGDEKLESSAFFSGKDNLSKVVRLLDGIQVTDNTSLFKELSKSQFKKGITIVLTDCFDEHMTSGINYLNYRKQELVLIQVLDKTEIDPRLKGELKLVDVEKNTEVNVTVTKAVLESYQKNYLDFIQNIKDTCNKYGNKHILVSSEASIDEILFNQLGKAGLLG